MKHLKAWLRPNRLTPDKNDFLAVPVTNGSLSVADIIKELRREGMEIQEETALDIITRFNRKSAELVCEGYNVNTGLVRIRPTIKGVFHGKTWDDNEHKFHTAFSGGTELRKVIDEVKVEILGEQSSPMSIFGITDMSNSITDGHLTKGKNAEIKGSYIKVAGDAPENGVIFRNIDDNNEVKLTEKDIVINEPSRLLILVPDTLPKGHYELSITTQYSNSQTLLKDPRTEVSETEIIIG